MRIIGTLPPDIDFSSRGPNSCAQSALILFVLHCRPGGVEGVLARTHQWRTQPDACWGKLDRPARDLSLALLMTEDIHCLICIRCVDLSGEG